MKNNPLDEIYITSPFGVRTHPITKKKAMHYGVDLRGSIGTPVYSVDDGVVLVSKYTSTGSGEYITIKHSGYYSFYCHLDKRRVYQGQKVKAGDVIGTVGDTGASTAAHLHFGLCTKYVASSINSSLWFNPQSAINEVMMKLKNLKIKLNGKVKTVKAIEYQDRNYVQLRDLADADKTDKFEVTYDAKTDSVVVNTK